MIEKLDLRTSVFKALLAAVLATTSLASGQMPGVPAPPHYAWSNQTFSPDARADLVLKEMTLEEKISILQGNRGAFGPPCAV
ncbi:MAG TPA: hypothetical protein VI320_19575 [Terracidiphilus sp.]